MAWPEDYSKLTTEIPEGELAVIRFGMRHELGEWKDVSEFAGYCTATYMFNDQEYEIQEEFELITSINRKE